MLYRQFSFNLSRNFVCYTESCLVVTSPGINMSRNVLIAAIVSRSPIKFSFSQRLSRKRFNDQSIIHARQVAGISLLYKI